MATESQSLLERVSARLGWRGDPKELQSKEQLPRANFGGFLSPDPEVEEVPGLETCTQKLPLSDSDTENPSTNCQRKQKWSAKYGPNGLGRSKEKDGNSKVENTNFIQKTPRSAVVISDSSDDDFENFLTQLKTPKQSANKVSYQQDVSLKDFDSEEDFASIVPRNGKGAKGKNGIKNSKIYEASPISGRNRSYQDWVYPVFKSDSDDEDSIVLKSTLWDRTKGRRNIHLDNVNQPNTEASCTQDSLQKNYKENRPERHNDLCSREKQERAVVHELECCTPESSEDEFESLVERIKNRTKTQTPCSTASKTIRPKTAVTEPTKVPCFDLTNTGSGSRRKCIPQSLLQSSSCFPSDEALIGSLDPPEKLRLDHVKTPCKVPDCFLQDLSHPKSPYMKNFKQKKEELTHRLYSFYNCTIFDQKLPKNMEVIWNKKMRKTAGYCVTGQMRCPELQRYARIELSEKVCDSAERLRDTLIHEICHAATWLIHGVRDGHGQFWRFYASKCTVIHPELPMVTRCHTYEINYKFNYECSRCKNTIGRHSKSLDIQKFVCAVCQGKLVLLTSARKDGTPSNTQLAPFAKFVKENYGSAKKEMTGLSHAGLMRKLSADFSTKTNISDS
ncbi:germ cell nuclear acidic protein isoform X2 [Ascaphus truei]|uniref:germ cell nuclear acidic protein isoform X2 n=1 Tax=Ascaphus truei TaxID=8439 RepID=UPI003F5A048E